jgi:VWFA-related protein
VVDAYGQPVTGLKPEDFRVLVAGREVPVMSVDWVSSAPGPETRPEAGTTPQDGSSPATRPAAPGKLVVFFVQANMDPSRFKGQIKLREHTRKLLGTLGTEDRIAVLSFDSHLKLRQDFTRDREAVHRAIDQGMRFGGKPLPRPAGEDPESLAAHLDFQRAQAVASPEAALAVTAQALGPLSGEKVVIFLGYGLGKMVADSVQLRNEYDDALQALGEAHASVFVLDVTQADFHTLESGLVQIAAQTGGTYAKTHIFPNLATETLANAISGYYVLTFDRDTLPRGGGTLRIKLRDGKKGTVLARPPGTPDSGRR